jgi:hypothetical protein
MSVSASPMDKSPTSAAHNYRPFYLPSEDEDTLPGSDSLDAAKREYFMAAMQSVSASPTEESSTSAAHNYRPFYLPSEDEDTLPGSDSLEAAKRKYFMAAMHAFNNDIADKDDLTDGSRFVLGCT